MSKHRFVLFSLLGLSGLLVCLAGCVPAKQPKAQAAGNKRPNIIYIYADDLGYGELGSYGQQKIQTPHLDRLASEGLRFTQHYTSAPVCAPARAMLMTGKHSGHSPIRGNYELGGFTDSAERGQLPLPEGTFTVAHLLKSAGYTTALFGKWGLGMAHNGGSPLQHGFDYYYGYLDQKQAHNYYPTHLWENDRWDTLNQPFIDVYRKLTPAQATDSDFDYFKGKDYAPQKMTEKALAFLEGNKDKPFFLYMPYTLPHLSLQVPDEWVNQYVGRFEEKPYYGARGYAAHKYPRSAYAAMITYLDAQVGIIMEKVKQLGLEDNTLIMFSSDNGATFHASVDTKFFNSAGGLRGEKTELYEGGIRMPFIARWPGRIAAGTTSGHVSAQYDFLATVAELTGQKVPQTDGLSFLPELLGDTAGQRKHDYLFFEFPEKGGQLAIRMGDWKGIKTGLKKDPKAPWQLFNLRTDRNETTDVAAQHPDLLRQFDVIVKKEHVDTPVEKWQFAEKVIRQAAAF